MDTVLNYRSSGQKVCCFFFFSCSKAEGREAGTTVTVGPSSSVLCSAYTALAIERQWQTLRAARGNRVTNSVKLEMLRRVLNMTRGGIFGFLGSRNEKGEKKTISRHCWTVTNTHLRYFSRHLINADCTLSFFFKCCNTYHTVDLPRCYRTLRL